MERFENFYANEYLNEDIEYLNESLVVSTILAYVVVAAIGYYGTKWSYNFIRSIYKKVKNYFIDKKNALDELIGHKIDLTRVVKFFRKFKKNDVIEKIKKDEPRVQRVVNKYKSKELPEELKEIMVALENEEKEGRDPKARVLWNSLPSNKKTTTNKMHLILKIIEKYGMPFYAGTGKHNHSYILIKNFLDKNEAQRITKQVLEIVENYVKQELEEELEKEK